MKEAMAIIGCLIVVLAGVMLLYVDKAQAVAGTSVSSPTVSTYPETILAGNNNTWDFQFTATNALSSSSVITVNYPADFKINNDEDHKYINFATNQIYQYIPIVTVNDLAASSIVVSGQQLQIQIANVVSAGSVVKLSIIKEALSNPATGGTKNILLWTSSDIDPVSIPVTIESSSLAVVLSNQYEGARNVSYKLTYRTRETIDYENPIYPVLPSDLISALYSMDPSMVTLNGIAVNEIYDGDGIIMIYPSSATHIEAGQTVTLEFTAEAGLTNPLIEDVADTTQKIGIKFESGLYEWADITYIEDNIAPTGSIAVHGIAAGGTTFSRSILLDLSATDVGSGVVEYVLSETEYFSFQNVLEYKPLESQVPYQAPYTLSNGTGPKTIYIKYYDGAGNSSEASQITVNYDDKLSFGSLTVKDDNSANVALSPTFSNAQNVYDAVVSPVTNTLKINISKLAAANIGLGDSRAVYTPVNATNGEITFSNLTYGSNDLNIRVSGSEGYNDYHLVIFKEGPVLQHANNTTVINNGSILSLGGKKWIVTDSNKRQLTLLEAYRGCAYGYESSECDWDGYGSEWSSEGELVNDGYRFDPQRTYSIAHYLNHSFLNSLGNGKNLISLYPFDNTIYSTGSVSRWSDEHRVMAAVGLLSIPQYQSLAGTGVLNRFLGSDWFLMNPAHAGSNIYMYSVDSEGFLASNWQSKRVHPVVYLKSGLFVSGGNGEEANPYTLPSSASIESIKLQTTALGYSDTVEPPVFSLSVSNEIKNTALDVTMTDAAATVVFDSIDQPSGGTAQASVTNPMTIKVTDLTEGVTTVHVHGLAADNISRKNYDIKITRAAPASFNNATLGSLKVEGVTISPDANRNLSASVSNAVYTTTITNAVYELGARITIKLSTGVEVTLGQPVNLNEGANVFTVVVTAPDGTTKLTYSLTITRAVSGSTGGQQEVAVTAAQPIVTLAGGTTIDFTGSTFGPNAKVSVTEVTPLNTSGTGMVSAGKTLEFTLTGIIIDPLKPVKFTIPTNTNANRSKIGVFYYNPSTLSWEYQKTEIDNTGVASVKVTHFSTYGVFEANKVATPTLDSLYINDTTKQVTLSTSTSGAAIYFTLDGSEPTTASSLYNSSNKPNLLSTQTLKAIAVKNGMVTSEELMFPRRTINKVLIDINNKTDQNGDNKFDETDVRMLLKQVGAVLIQ
ncbi:chitobiase/beta-hexosaminidase C-terminal domain-containing protein [Paenibacillus sp. WQ 127069]|uniref:Chitobiase/beta-hexosaminidase C-terminal domain-containing protein n=1 Tax=Paenibacillus baimaensis TaxID=2982185 RepID=A0ABT2UQM9_9BACL|nr:chitobiase/beta-hexosaminidase C-terminal domain-containing protein [Paenibacillus sp. WQ 127069]